MSRDLTKTHVLYEIKIVNTNLAPTGLATLWFEGPGSQVPATLAMLNDALEALHREHNAGALWKSQPLRAESGDRIVVEETERREATLTDRRE